MALFSLDNPSFFIFPDIGSLITIVPFAAKGDKRKRRAIKRKRFMLNKKEVSLLD